jgi:hypothetical protein
MAQALLNVLQERDLPILKFKYHIVEVGESTQQMKPMWYQCLSMTPPQA